MAAIAGHRLTLDPMGKCSNAFFWETTNMIKAKLYMNVHWMILYNLKVFCSDMKFKMAATAGLSLTLDPMGKMFQNASSLKPLGQLKPNCPGMIIGRSSIKFLVARRTIKIFTLSSTQSKIHLEYHLNALDYKFLTYYLKRDTDINGF